MRKEEFDVVVGVGDYGGIDEWRPWLKKDFDNSKRGLSRISPEKFFGKNRFNELVKKDISSTKEVFKKISKFLMRACIKFCTIKSNTLKFYPGLEKGIQFMIIN